MFVFGPRTHCDCHCIGITAKSLGYICNMYLFLVFCGHRVVTTAASCSTPPMSQTRQKTTGRVSTSIDWSVALGVVVEAEVVSRKEPARIGEERAYAQETKSRSSALPSPERCPHVNGKAQPQVSAVLQFSVADKEELAYEAKRYRQPWTSRANSIMLE